MNADRALRVLQVSPSDVGGGAERVAADLHRGAQGSRIESHLAVGFRFGSGPDTVEIPNDARRSPWARALLGFAPRVPAPPASLSPSQVALRRTLKAAAEPGRALRRARGFEDFDYPGTAALPTLAGEPADVLHMHNLHGGYFDLRLLPELSERIPTVVTLHDAWLTTGHCAYTLECERWRTGCGQCPHLDTYPALPRDRTAENWARKRDILRRSRLHVVGPSRWVLDRAADSILAPGAIEMRQIPNGVDQGVFAPADKLATRSALGLAADALIVVFHSASSGNLYKDVATITSSLPAIAERLRPQPVLFIALGAPADAAPVRGAEVVAVPYSSDPRHVARYLQAADLALHAAHAENLPLAVIEAQCCGLPVVATNVGGVSETLMNGETGLLVAPEDPEALSEAASALLLDGARRVAMGAAALELATRRFGLDRMLDAYFDLYRELASGS